MLRRHDRLPAGNFNECTEIKQNSEEKILPKENNRIGRARGGTFTLKRANFLLGTKINEIFSKAVKGE